MKYKDKLTVSECIKCKKITWPQTFFCKYCLNKTNNRYLSSHGTVIEFSKKNKDLFCIGKFENIKLMGIIDNKKNICIGQKIKLYYYIKQNIYKFKFKLR